MRLRNHGLEQQGVRPAPTCVALNSENLSFLLFTTRIISMGSNEASGSRPEE